MEKITGYAIALGDAATITNVVNEKIKAGYEPFGSAFIYAQTTQIVQPMVIRTLDVTPEKFRS